MSLKDRMEILAAKLDLRAAKDRAESFANIMNNHLAKLYFMPNDKAKNQWYRSIYNAVDSMHDIWVALPKRKKLTKTEYYMLMSDLDNINPLVTFGVDLKIKRYNLQRSITNIYDPHIEPHVERIYEDFYKKLSIRLTQKQSVTTQEVYTMLNELLQQLQISIGD